ncbi:Folylpolyglutamate synthase [Candidatus Filomicrobium marinum]|uniref:Dihydrofolate synthase/folylpolyglutamate synthase n=1 Tax=Candidatus Filomicrobium marinum TaxID=1608628 RepID=A0A0D6JF05_9HYPH|nr:MULTISPECIES: folylpolyglutamate synthase/dihydrofolate synthase family protein [Filomicrobium]MCV0367862.1 bifunctional folylpolyglutamate synthase/dihydrofolate synthase [Filomicrobium sp.]CFX19440.1 Folylpolyglutamate synthase [Candidatus Filomicrobium marinum]CPR18516.1 Folylpolyglutamate synthase [Candidatus Filomicrobium marinum]
MSENSRSTQLLAELKSLHPKLIDLSLGRIERLLAKLGDPHKRLPPVVHVAGTNGKGSTTAFLRSIFEAAGLRAHVYTSPHLVRFHERITLAGRSGEPAQAISEADLVDVLSRTQAVNNGDDITQFEITTAAAFLAYAENPADVLLLEVGLGGRLDATNVIAKPEISVITPISLDHADKLGDTLAQIATEKAGIIKPGVPVVVSMQPDEALSAIGETAERVGSRMIAWGRDFDAYEQRGRLVVQRHEQLLDLQMPSLIGPHQIVNAATAVTAALEMPRFALSEEAIEQGVMNAVWPARMQRLHDGPLPDMLHRGSELWLDGGHNPAAGAMIAQALADLEERSPRPLYLVLGMMGLKDVTGFVANFRGLARQIYSVPIPGAHEAPHTPQAVAESARSAGISAEEQSSVPAALATIERLHPGPKRVLICGSLYLAGQVLALQEGVEAQSN